jgi:alpha-tubulin suppressor-like RCC1 family protein
MRSDRLSKKSDKSTDIIKKENVIKKVLENDIFVYEPNKNNDVLTIGYTVQNLIMLLKNGVCITWGMNRSTLGRRCQDSQADSYVPKPIKIPAKVVDVVCGRQHCLARGVNYKVYCWGYNTHGQLGLSGLSNKSSLEQDEPAEIQTFSNIKVKQIYASGNSSFAITDGGNSLYGWGDNRHGQLGLNIRQKQIEVPTKIEMKQKISQEFIIALKKDGSKTYLCELYRPASSISQAMLFFQNKQLHFKEIDLINEKSNLDIQEQQIRKRLEFGKNANVL